MIAKIKEKSSAKANISKKSLKQFNDLTKSRFEFLKEQREIAEKSKTLTKTLYDSSFLAVKDEGINDIPEELFIEQMDEEQIWQQLELQNESLWEKCFQNTCRLLSMKDDKLSLKINYENENVEDEEAEDIEEDENFENNENSFNENEDLENEIVQNDDNSNDESVEDGDDDSDDGVNLPELEEDDPIQEKKKKSLTARAVDDDFFQLDEMEAFLDREDKKELNKKNGKYAEESDEEDSEEEIDYFEDLDEDFDEDEEAKTMKYGSFFRAETSKPIAADERRTQRLKEREQKNKVKSLQKKEDLGIGSDEEEEEEEAQDELENDDDEVNEESENEYENDQNVDYDENVEKSEFELRQSRLRRRIEELEEQAVTDKPWQLKGEIDSTARPKNSLLEEVLEFDATVRPAPVITEATTLKLEDIIKQRIQSKAWDDVERKIKPVNERDDFRKKLVLDQEKSKESLAQIYEKEYMDKLNKMNGTDQLIEKNDEPESHKEIRRQMKDLFAKLDALSNFHFTAKPVAVEAKVITNVPVIEMEEVAPVAVSDAHLLAPEEVRAHPKGDEIGKSERTSSDKKRERRQKKVHQKLKSQANERKIAEKEKLGLKVNSKERQEQLTSKLLKNRNVIKPSTSSKGELAPKSSKAFFEKLQDNLRVDKSMKSSKKKKLSMDSSGNNAKRLKL